MGGNTHPSSVEQDGKPSPGDESDSVELSRRAFMSGSWIGDELRKGVRQADERKQHHGEDSLARQPDQLDDNEDSAAFAGLAKLIGQIVRAV